MSVSRERRMVKGSSVNYAFAFEFRECWTMNSVDQSANEMKRGEFLVKVHLRVAVSRVLSSSCSHPRSKVSVRLRELAERERERGTLEISSHADRFTALATSRRSSTTAPFDSSFFPFFSFFSFLPFLWVLSLERMEWLRGFFSFFFFEVECFARIREAFNEGSSSLKENWFALWSNKFFAISGLFS